MTRQSLLPEYCIGHSIVSTVPRLGFGSIKRRCAMLDPHVKSTILHRRLRTLAVVLLGAVSLTACGTNTGTGDTNTASGFPLTAENCGQQVTIEQPPERVVLIYW